MLPTEGRSSGQRDFGTHRIRWLDCDLDISLPRADIEIKLGERASDTAGKVNARNTYLPSRGGLPYYLASEIPQNVLDKWQAYPRAIPIDIRTAANQG